MAAAAHVLPAIRNFRVPDVLAIPSSVARARDLPVGRDGLEADGSEGVARSPHAAVTGVGVLAHNAVATLAVGVRSVAVDVDGRNRGDKADKDVGSVHLVWKNKTGLFKSTNRSDVAMGTEELDGKAMGGKKRDLHGNLGSFYISLK